MFSKFKIGRKVRVKGFGKNDGKYYCQDIGVIVEKDYYFKDYRIKFKNNAEDWLDEECLTLITPRKEG